MQWHWTGKNVVEQWKAGLPSDNQVHQPASTIRIEGTASSSENTAHKSIDPMLMSFTCETCMVSKGVAKEVHEENLSCVLNYLNCWPETALASG